MVWNIVKYCQKYLVDDSKVISIGKTLQVNNIFYFIEHRNCVHSTPDGPIVF